MIHFVAPKFEATAYNCPHCNAFAQQTHCSIYVQRPNEQAFLNQELKLYLCTNCRKPMIWFNQKPVYPEVQGGLLPNDDLNEDIKQDFNEARLIVNKSPRGAVALLRLCVQKLCKQLGQKGENINEDIKALVKVGLPIQIQQALDILRVIGNSAVHPGQIDLKDDIGTANYLFQLINQIADRMITEPNKLQALYDSLPQGSKDAIAKRDGLAP